MFNKLARPVVAEFLGTTILALVYLVLTQTTAVSYFIGTSVAIALGVIYMMFAGVSGAHFNPALTLANWTVRKTGTVAGILYIAAQFLGGFVAWKMFEGFTNHTLAAHITNWDWRIVLAEATGTLIVAFGFVAAARKGLSALESALTYGFSLFVGIMVASIAFAGGYLNPAVALGVHSFDWTYLVAPVVGALVGVNLYAYLFDGAKLPTLAAKKK